MTVKAPSIYKDTHPYTRGPGRLPNLKETLETLIRLHHACQIAAPVPFSDVIMFCWL